MISNKQKKIIIEALQPFQPKKIGIFGSTSRGDDHNDSDIDILFEFTVDYNLLDLGGLYEDLKDRLQKDVDLVDYSSIPYDLKQKILNEQHLIYGN